MEPGAVMKSRGVYSPKGTIPALPSLLKIPFGVVTLFRPEEEDLADVESLIEYSEAIVAASELLEDGDVPVWNPDTEGWDFYSNDPLAIEIFSEGNEGESAYDFPDLFIDAVDQHVGSRRSLFHGFSVEQLVDQWISEYVVSASGYFSKKDAGSVSNVSTEVEEEEVLIDWIDPDDYSEEHF